MLFILFQKTYSLQHEQLIVQISYNVSVYQSIRYQHVIQQGISVNPSAFTRLQLSGFCDHWGQAAMGPNGSCRMQAWVRIQLLHSRIDGIPREMGFGGHLSGAVPIAGVGSFLELNFLQAIHKIPFETSSRCVKDNQVIQSGQKYTFIFSLDLLN